MTAPAGYGAEFPNTLTGTNTVTSNIPITDIVPGQNIYLGLFYIATRTSGSSTGTIRPKIKWYDAANSNFATTQSPDITINGTLSAYVWNEAAHLVPTGAVKGIIAFDVIANGATLQHDVFLTAIQAGRVQYNADVTATLVGPAQSDILYDSVGTTFQSATTCSFSVQTASGFVTGGLSMSFRVIDGNINGFDFSSGWQTMTVTSGVADFVPTAMTTDSATVEFAPTLNGRTLPSAQTVFTKVRGAAPPSGAGAGDSPLQSSGFTAINTATFTTITNVLTFTMPTGKTTLRCTISLGCAYPRTADQVGPWDVEMKVQRNISGTYTDQGSVQHSNPDNNIHDTEDGKVVSSPGSVNATVDMTGLTAGVQYSIRVQARVATGTLPSASNMVFSGAGISLSAP